MSKRAEQKALEAYPIHSVLIQPARRGGYYADTHFREGFINGYEQALSDIKSLIESNLAPGYAGKIIRLIEQNYE